VGAGEPVQAPRPGWRHRLEAVLGPVHAGETTGLPRRLAILWGDSPLGRSLAQISAARMNARFANVAVCAVCTYCGMSPLLDPPPLPLQQRGADHGDPDGGADPLGGDQRAAGGAGLALRHGAEHEVLVGRDHDPVPQAGDGRSAAETLFR
jgi:hypothetical protein